MYDDANKVLVKNKISGKLYEMTKLPDIMSSELIEDALREQTTLIECRTIEHLPKVIDYFKEDYVTYILISHAVFHYP